METETEVAVRSLVMVVVIEEGLGAVTEVVMGVVRLVEAGLH